MKKILFIWFMAVISLASANAQVNFPITQSDILGIWSATGLYDTKTGKEKTLDVEKKFAYGFSTVKNQGNPVAFMKAVNTEMTYIYTIVNNKVFMYYYRNTKILLERLKILQLEKGKSMVVQRTLYVGDEEIDLGTFVMMYIDEEE